MPSMVVKQICTWQMPPDLPNPPAELTPGALIYLAIEFDGHGYCLLATEIDGDYNLSEWHPSLKTAERQAAQRFGPTVKDWETLGMP